LHPTLSHVRLQSRNNRGRPHHKANRNRLPQSDHPQAQVPECPHLNDHRGLGLFAAQLCPLHQQRAERYVKRLV